jgi:hypothetical protein
MAKLLGSKFPVSFDYESESFLEISAGLSERATLCVHTGDLFNISNVPAAAFLDHRRK